MLDDIYREYGGYFFLPMTQAYSVAVPVTIGCSWNKCNFCSLNSMHNFRFLGLDEIEKRLKKLKEYYDLRKRIVKKIVLAGANPFCLDTEILLGIIELIKRCFPDVENISSFARVDDILRKNQEELDELKKAGMGELVLGIESGSNKVLKLHNKGVTSEDTILGLSKLENSNISYATHIILGLGGKELSRQNAIDTGRLLSEFNPQVIIVVTLVLFKDAKIIEKIKTKEFTRLRPLETLEEEKLLLENLNMRNSIFNGTHKTNTLILKGRLPEQKNILMGKIDYALENRNSKDLNNEEMLKWSE